MEARPACYSGDRTSRSPVSVTVEARMASWVSRARSAECPQPRTAKGHGGGQALGFVDGSCKSCGTFRALAVVDPTFLEWRPGGRGYRDRLTTRPHHWMARPDHPQSIPCDREAHSGLDGKGHGSVRQIGGRIMELLSRCMGRVPLPDDQGSCFQAGSQTQVLTFSADSRSCCSIGRLRC